MSATIRNLLKLEIFKNVITLVSKDCDLDTAVTWPYIKQMKELAPWINGGEIVFVMGNNGDDTVDRQISILKEGQEHGVSAFVFLYGSQYIDDIDSELIEYANKIKMPLFKIHYNVKLIDIVKEISNAILQADNMEKLIFNFMNDLLNKNFVSEEHIIKQGYECGIIIDNNCCAMVLNTNFNYENANYDKILTYRNTMNYVLKRIEQIGNQLGFKIISYFRMDKAVCLIFVENSRDIEKISNEINEFLDYFFEYNELAVFVGYSNIHKGVKGCLKAVDEGEKAVKFAEKSDSYKISCNYSDMGFLGLVVNYNTKEELMSYCRDTLGVLIDSDKENNTEYMLTVKVFLENNNNIIASANKLFIHRNTLINRINHIEQLTGRSLKDADVKMEYLCVFKLLEFMSD